MMYGGWTYIMANNHLAARVFQHREGVGSAFCRRYGIKTLVYAEAHETIQDAIWREKALKAWNRAWKIRLIEELNPEWRDLYDTLA
jgi:putative endonuclease